MKEPKEGTLRSRIFQLLKDNPAKGYRPPQVAEKLGEDVASIVPTMAQMSADDGLFTRCKVMVPGQRDSWEYRIATAAAGGGMPKELQGAFTIGTTKALPRRDETQPPIPSSHGQRPAQEDDKAAAPAKRKYTRRKAAKGKRAAPVKRHASRKTPAKRQRMAKLQASAANLQPAAAPPSTPGFRCAVFSDGSLAIHARRGAFEMEPDETQQLFSYLEKVVREVGAS